MFYGIEVKSGQNQAKPTTLENAIKLTQAVLDVSKNGKKEPVSLIVEYNKKQFVICNLDSTPGSWQCPLDLIFEGGAQLKFFLRGTGTVHLTGYETFNELDDMSMSMSDDDEEVEIFDEDDEDDQADSDDSDGCQIEEVPTVSSKMVKSSGKKVIPTPKGKTNGHPVNGKKLALTQGGDAQYDSDDESDDEDFDADEVDDDDDEDDEDEELDDEDLENSEDDDDIDVDEEMDDDDGESEDE